MNAATPITPQTLSLPVEGMHCASCAGRVERALAAVPGVTGAVVNLATGRATVAGAAGMPALITAIGTVGYKAEPVIAHGVTARGAMDNGTMDHGDVGLRRDLILSAVLALPVVVLEMGGI